MIIDTRSTMKLADKKETRFSFDAKFPMFWLNFGWCKIIGKGINTQCIVSCFKKIIKVEYIQYTFKLCMV